MTTLTEPTGRSGTPAVTAVAVTAIVLALARPFAGHPVVTPAAVGGLLVPAAVAAVAGWRWRLLSPAAMFAIIGGGVLAVEIATPGPVVAALGEEQLTTGTAVLEAHLAAWPLTAALLLLAAVTEAALRGGWRAVAAGPDGVVRGARPGWGRSLGYAAATGLALTGCAALAGALTEGWTTTPPPWVAVGPGYLAFSAFLGVLVLLRGRLVTPVAVVGLVLLTAVAVTAVTGGAAAPLSGYLLHAATWGLLPGAVEAGLRAVVRRVRRRPVTAGVHV